MGGDGDRGTTRLDPSEGAGEAEIVVDLEPDAETQSSVSTDGPTVHTDRTRRTVAPQSELSVQYRMLIFVNNPTFRSY